MKALVWLALVLLVLCAAAAVQARPAQAAGGGEFEQRMLDIRPVDPQEFIDRAGSVTEKVWLLARAYSVPMVVVSLVGGALLILAGAVLGKGVARAGTGMIFAGLLAFVLINFAPEIAGLARALAASIVGGAVK